MQGRPTVTCLYMNQNYLILLSVKKYYVVFLLYISISSNGFFMFFKLLLSSKCRTLKFPHDLFSQDLSEAGYFIFQVFWWFKNKHTIKTKTTVDLLFFELPDSNLKFWAPGLYITPVIFKLILLSHCCPLKTS